MKAKIKSVGKPRPPIGRYEKEGVEIGLGFWFMPLIFLGLVFGAIFGIIVCF